LDVFDNIGRLTFKIGVRFIFPANCPFFPLIKLQRKELIENTIICPGIEKEASPH
jgi:hypothetical protein